MASVVKIVIENFLLVAHLSIIHTRFNLCCRIEMGLVFFCASLSYNHENFKRGFTSSNPPYNWIQLAKWDPCSIFEVEIKSSTYCVQWIPQFSLSWLSLVQSRDVSFSIGPLGNGRRFWHLPRDGMMIIKQAKKYGEKWFSSNH